MWGSLTLEVFYITSFNYSFPPTYNDVLLNLTFWQYWWWFWFIFFFVLYYLLALRFLRFRFIKFNPKIVTSYRAHGKWGDIIICFVPISWCLNIITNSNLLLRLLEWQGETGLLTIRVRGKQWYWIYKFELKSFIDILQIKKNFGFSKNLKINFTTTKNLSNHSYFLNIRNSNKSIYFHWRQHFYDTSYCHSNLTHSSNNLNFLINSNILTLFSTFSKFQFKTFIKSQQYYLNFFFNDQVLLINHFWWRKKGYWELIFNLYYKPKNSKSLFISKLNSLQLVFSKLKFFNLYSSSDFLESFRYTKSYNFNHNLSVICEKKKIDKSFFFFLKFKKTETCQLDKNNIVLTFLVIKQKRFVSKFFNLKVLEETYFTELTLKSLENFFFKSRELNLDIYRILNRNSLSWSSLLNNTLSKRLLKTRRILVLPAHFNISVITNSFDVVHSWYVPGLGIKLDCVPGRSTHHNIYITNYGFYYGQCAEICGRYHHHMPIRVCALPFEHFCIWWYNYSINVYCSFTKSRLDYNGVVLKNYSW